MNSRRNFIVNSSAVCMSFMIPNLARSFVRKIRRLSVGVIADLHHDLMPDSLDRMQVFVDDMKRSKPDAIIQMGDFAYPNSKNLPVIDLFNGCHTNRLHVIGNHDTDSGHTHQQCINFWGMPATYYAQSIKGFRFVVLNGNEKGSPTHRGGYPAYIGPEQMGWLKSQLEASHEPVIILCHQPILGSVSGIDNAKEIQGIISNAKDKVIMIMNGHDHVDALHYVDDIPYLTINSASYFWVGSNFINTSYPEEIHAKYPWVSRTCPYKDSLFTTLTIDPNTATISLKPRKSTWLGKSPEELGVNETNFPDQEIVPFIRERSLYVKGRVSNF